MEKNCNQCSASFHIAQSDVDFFDKISPSFHGVKYQIPAPKLCPDCRQQRRQAFRNEYRLYKRTCDCCQKEIISVYPKNTSFPVYCASCWYSDTWNPLEYGQGFDFSQPFFKQFAELRSKVPRLALFTLQSNENSDYTNWSDAVKNCYLLFSSSDCEDCSYSSLLVGCQDCSDCFNCQDCELCFEVMNSNNCYHTLYSSLCDNTRESAFCYACQGCEHCLLCTNLINQKYCYKNEQLTKEEWKKKWQEYCETHTGVEKGKQEFSALIQEKGIHRFAHMNQCENCTGDNILRSKNALNCFDSKNLHDCKNIIYGVSLKDCMDAYATVDNTELSYEFLSVNGGHSVLFCIANWDVCQNMFYSELIKSSSHCFGCIGLKRAQYCILNKQYTKEEYEELVPKIIKHMKQTGEWGEFFPVEFSVFAYNETVAQDYFPMTKKEVLAKGWKWKEADDSLPNVSKIIPATRLPETIQDIPDDVLHWAIRCEVTGRPFKIQKSELSFYRKMNISLPRKHPDQRHKERTLLRNPRKLWIRNCSKCNKEVQTSHTPNRAKNIYCEECYLSAVY